MMRWRLKTGVVYTGWDYDGVTVGEVVLVADTDDPDQIDLIERSARRHGVLLERVEEGQ